MLGMAIQFQLVVPAGLLSIISSTTILRMPLDVPLQKLAVGVFS